MTVATARRVHWTVEEYLAFENRSPEKHEYFDGEVFAMAGARPRHNLVVVSTSNALGGLVKGKGCAGFNGDQRIYIAATGLYTYADGGVMCAPPELSQDGMELLNPVLLFEVLSPSTRDYDLGAKREHYQQMPSLRHLLLIDQPERLVRHYSREGGNWQSREIREGLVDLAELGSFSLEDLYAASEELLQD